MTFKLLSVTHKIVPSNVQLPNSDSPKLLISICQKIMKGRGNGHVGEPGDHEGVGIFDKFFSAWFSRPP